MVSWLRPRIALLALALGLAPLASATDAEAPENEAAETAHASAPAARAPWDNGVDPFAPGEDAPSAPEAEDAAGPGQSVEATLRGLTTLGALSPAASSLNPGNGLLSLPRQHALLEARPELTVGLGRWTLFAKPRAELEWSRAHPGDGEVQGRAYLLGWFARWEALPGLYLSGGSEFLQWGPSLLISPSNMFFLENERASPVAQVPGSYFARAVWALSPAWTLSAIVNAWPGEEQRLTRPFERRYALKVDYAGPDVQVTGIASYGERSALQAGGYVVWTATDALLLYTDFRIDTRSQVLYPTPASASDPLGSEMKDRPGSWDPALHALVGASYTLPGNLTLTAEYLYQSDGYGREDAARLGSLRGALATSLLSGQEDAHESSRRLPDALDPGLRFLRRHYTVLQAQWGAGDTRLSLWWVRNWSDGSNSFIPSLEVPVSDHLSLVGFGIVNIGGKDSEFRSVLNAQAVLGASFTF